MIDYEDIRTANETIRTTTIEKQNKKTGEVTKKEYAEVNQRVKAFRMLYPEGSIVTELLSNENGVCIFKATVLDCDLVLATGTAYEKEGSSFINSTSYIENCETSAVGRALGFAGIGIDTSIASAEEVQNAQIQQAAQEKIDGKMVRSLRERCGGEETEQKILKLYKVDRLEDLTMRQLVNINQNWKKIGGDE